jgi:hypothetical protein
VLKEMFLCMNHMSLRKVNFCDARISFQLLSVPLNGPQMNMNVFR